MKIYYDNVNISSQSGPNTFGKRLYTQLQKVGHSPTTLLSDCDIVLSFIQQRYRGTTAGRRVLRLDGIWTKPDKFVENNKEIAQAYKNYDAVIVQTEYDKKMIEKYFGLRDKVFVIHNGIDFDYVSKIPAADMSDANADKIFVCAASWHPQKRLEDNIRLFQHIRKKECKNSYLLILGKIGYNLNISKDMLENVVHLGQKSHEECLSIYKSSDYFIHLAWMDHCPNVVVEALACGTPVICSNSGGTKEIVRDSGLIIKEKYDFNYELFDFDKPWDMDIKDFKLSNIKVSNSHLDISKIAEKYIDVFEKVLQ